MIKNLEAVIFDLDGTLVDSVADLANAMNAVLSEHHLPTHDIDAYKYFVGNGIKKLVERSIPEDCRTSSFVSELHSEMVQVYKKRCVDCTKPYSGIEDLLRFLSKKGVRICVLSNKMDELTQRIVKALFGEYEFSVVRGACPDVPIKPDPQGALLIAEELKIRPQNILYLGDTNVDMETANASRMTAVGCTWGFRTEQELLASGAKFIVRHPSEIKKFFL